jgi:hypothetical protein
MIKIITLSIALFCLANSTDAQTTKKKTKKAVKAAPVVKNKTVVQVAPVKDSVIKLIKDTTAVIIKTSSGDLPSTPNTIPAKVETPEAVTPVVTDKSSNNDVISGLREALRIGTDNSSKKLNKVDGFFADAAIKILMPEEAKKMEKTLRNFGLGSVVDDAILSMNRAAEDAAGGIGTIFWDAIKQMNISDGLQILRGGDFAATDYLKKTTTATLTSKFRPVIETSLAKTGAAKYWKDAFSAYNNFSSTPVNTDLAAYVTEKALQGLFLNISLEEQKIRKDPAAQVTNLLKNVFGKK